MFFEGPAQDDFAPLSWGYTPLVRWGCRAGRVCGCMCVCVCVCVTNAIRVGRVCRVKGKLLSLPCLRLTSEMQWCLKSMPSVVHTHNHTHTHTTTHPHRAK